MAQTALVLTHVSVQGDSWAAGESGGRAGLDTPEWQAAVCSWRMGEELGWTHITVRAVPMPYYIMIPN